MTRKRLKYLLTRPLQYGATESGAPLDATKPMTRYIRITDISENGTLRDDEPLYLPSEVARPYLLCNSDILLARSGATVGKSFYYDGIDNEACFAGYMIRASVDRKKAVPKFVHYCLQSGLYWDYVRASFSQATIQNLNAQLYGGFLVPYPVIEKQNEVVKFLDYETAKVDALVTKYERLIELLEEKRVTLIAQAVTKGLDPTVPMVDSGVEWIGEVPANWQQIRLRYLCHVETGGRDTIDASETGEYPFFVRSQEVERIDDYAFDCEAVLTAGDGVGVGKVYHYYNGKFNAHQRVYVLSGFKRALGQFVFHYLKSNFARVVLQGTAKSTVDSLRMPMLKDFVVCVPSSEEQHDIIKYCEEHGARIDKLIRNVQKAVELVREHRSALIGAAVTGQIDARTYRAQTLEIA